MDQYAISGGRAGFDRLKLLAQAHRKDTLELLSRAGVRRGMRCVDLGCGGGEVTFDIAKLIGRSGHVLGLDLDEVKIGLAREEAAARGHANVDFEQADVSTWAAPDAYDLVYCRFLLQHLRAPADLIARMWEAVRGGGLLIVEDTDFEGFFTDPPNDGFAVFLRTYLAVLAHRASDATIGRKLYRYFRQASIPDAQVSAALPVWPSGDEKGLALWTLSATADAVVAEGVATRDEIDRALVSLAAHTASPESVVGGPAVIQLWARRAD